jgi:hypothetical protein
MHVSELRPGGAKLASRSTLRARRPRRGQRAERAVDTSADGAQIEPVGPASGGLLLARPRPAAAARAAPDHLPRQLVLQLEEIGQRSRS